MYPSTKFSTIWQTAAGSSRFFHLKFGTVRHVGFQDNWISVITQPICEPIMDPLARFQQNETTRSWVILEDPKQDNASQRWVGRTTPNLTSIEQFNTIGECTSSIMIQSFFTARFSGGGAILYRFFLRFRMAIYTEFQEKIAQLLALPMHL